MIENGRLKQMIDSGLRGMTSNPTIFDKAISKSDIYDKQMDILSKQDNTAFQIYDELTVKDIQDAADLFMPVYEKTGGLDGYVSLEINPKLAFDIQATIEEGKRLHQKVARPNVMFKVPSTSQGFKAVEEFIASGININVTLIFSLEQYVNTAQAYMNGIKRLIENGGDPSKVRSVASVFVSRIDSAVDSILDQMVSEENDAKKKKELASLKGKAALANVKLIYKDFLEIFSSQEFQELEDRGANLQRVLWGSTSTKNPAYSDIKYVEELIAKNSVNTIPENTLEAFLDHGSVKQALTSDVSDAREIIRSLKAMEIDIDKVLHKLLDDGVMAFEKSFDSLLNHIEEKCKLIRQ
jgi:transaldolase